MLRALPLLVALSLYLLLWPVPISPTRWTPPASTGYVPPFELNNRLDAATGRPLGRFSGPEDAVWDGNEYLYLSTHQGIILRLRLKDGTLEPWVDTRGTPLGLSFHPNGHLIVADAQRGLLSISPEKQVTVLATEFNGVPLGFTDGVAVAENGDIYFTDASSKFGPGPLRSPLEASQLDLLEHVPNGRLLRYSPSTQTLVELQSGLYFPNGVAISKDQSLLLIAETGLYRVLRLPLKAPTGKPTVIRENLPGFPDNIKTGSDGRFWVGLVTPRNPLLDSTAEIPMLRSLTVRLPRLLRPKPAAYGHLIALDARGNIVDNLHGAQSPLTFVTGAIQTPSHLFVTSLRSKALFSMPTALLQ